MKSLIRIIRLSIRAFGAFGYNSWIRIIYFLMLPFFLKLNPKTHEELSWAKRKLAEKFKIPILTNSALIKEYRAYLAETKSKPDNILLSILKRRQVRTGSGVAPVAILTKPYPCPGECFYCPNEKGMPKSYLSNEPAVMRAILNKFDPYKQIHTRISALEANGHPTDKIEIIIMGGTWSYLPKSYQSAYIAKCFKACNEFGYPPRAEGNFSKRKNLSKKVDAAILSSLQNQNEKSRRRIVGLTLETRPDYITPDEIKRMREFGCTRVELGVQAIDEKILSLNKRGHGRKEIIEATKMLRGAGFKICYHLMVNLPGSNLRKDFGMFKELFENPDFQPDQIKIYPCVVTKNAPLYKWYKSGKYKPCTEKELLELIIKIKQIVPPYVRIIRVIRDIPTTSIVAGNKISNLREDIKKIMDKRGVACQCIRCREIKTSTIKRYNLVIRKYEAAGGMEYFLSYEDLENNKLLSFLRLRLPPMGRLSKKRHSEPRILRGEESQGARNGRCNAHFATGSFAPQSGTPDDAMVEQSRKGEERFDLRSVLVSGESASAQSRRESGEISKIFPSLAGKTAIIREAHTYGPAVEISKRDNKAAQHIGLGKTLIKKAEEIARENGCEKMAVISGVGARSYYRKLGYRLRDTYMVKRLGLWTSHSKMALRISKNC